MPSDDPTEELIEIIDLYRGGRLPVAAFDFANGALATAEEILEIIEEMEGNGHDRSANQESALENIYCGACNWLKK
jgi:hypothetical protein